MNTKQHSLGSLSGLTQRDTQHTSLPKTVKICVEESAGSIKQRLEQRLEHRLEQLTDRHQPRPQSRSVKLPPIASKLLNDYLTKPVELSVVTSDDGSRFLEGMQQQQA